MDTRAATIEERIPKAKRAAFRQRFEAMPEDDRPRFLANVEARLPPLPPAITPEEAEANFRERWGMSSREYFAREDGHEFPAAVVSCRDCQRFTPNEHSPRTGLGSCELRKHGHPKRGQWPSLKHRCTKYEQRPRRK